MYTRKEQEVNHCRVAVWNMNLQRLHWCSCGPIPTSVEWGLRVMNFRSSATYLGHERPFWDEGLLFVMENEKIMRPSIIMSSKKSNNKY